MLTASDKKNIKSLSASCSAGKVPPEARRFPMNFRASFLSQNLGEKPYHVSEPKLVRETKPLEQARVTERNHNMGASQTSGEKPQLVSA